MSGNLTHRTYTKEEQKTHDDRFDAAPSGIEPFSLGASRVALSQSVTQFSDSK
jgi:hypothetical protein